MSLPEGDADEKAEGCGQPCLISILVSINGLADTSYYPILPQAHTPKIRPRGDRALRQPVFKGLLFNLILAGFLIRIHERVGSLPPNNPAAQGVADLQSVPGKQGREESWSAESLT